MALDYADAVSTVATLRGARRAHQLDGHGLLEALGQAVVFCRQSSQHHAARAESHLKRKGLYDVAMAIYISTAKSLAGEDWEHGGFQGWCRKFGISRSTGWNLAKIGASSDPAAELAAFRKKNREQSYDSIERSTGRRPGGGIEKTDPLWKIKRAWRDLSPAQRKAFLVWAGV